MDIVLSNLSSKKSSKLKKSPQNLPNSYLLLANYLNQVRYSQNPTLLHLRNMAASQFSSTLGLLVTARDQFGIYEVAPHGRGIAFLLTRGVELNFAETDLVYSRGNQLEQAVGKGVYTNCYFCSKTHAKNSAAIETANECIRIKIRDYQADKTPTIQMHPEATGICCGILGGRTVHYELLNKYYYKTIKCEMEKWAANQVYLVYLEQDILVPLSEALEEQMDSKQRAKDNTAVLTNNLIQQAKIQALVPLNMNPTVGEYGFGLGHSYKSPSAQSSPQTVEADGVKVPMPHNWRPASMVLEDKGLLPVAKADTRGNTGFGGKFCGDLNSRAIKEQIYLLPNDRNCSLFIKGIPLAITYSDIFDRIHTGKVTSMYIVPPSYRHQTQAAKIVFDNPGSAKAFANELKSYDGRFMDGHEISVVYNRYGQPESDWGLKSRVIIIEGPADMTFKFWDDYFGAFSKFQYDRVFEFDNPSKKTKIIEFRFVRIDGQAETCMGAIKKNTVFEGCFRAWYGRDPCEPYP